MKVYKYVIDKEINTYGWFKIEMPEKADILTVQIQNETSCIWAIVEESAENVQRDFYVAGTGKTIPDEGLLYVGTFQQPPFVWHLFQKK